MDMTNMWTTTTSIPDFVLHFVSFKAPIASLSDLSLELVFSFLDIPDLVRASQVCTRWRDLCSSKRLWSSRRLNWWRWPLRAEEERALRAVRLLRRTQGVVRYEKVILTLGSCFSVSFSEDAGTLMLSTPSSLMALLSLRHLVKDHVKTLVLEEKLSLFTAFEALAVWETIASKTFITWLSITLCRASPLHGVVFDWPARGSLTTLWFSVRDHAPFATLCRPIRSLLQVHRDQLARVDIRSKDQQGLLDFLPPRLRTLQAVILPSLIQVLKPLKFLGTLFLRAPRGEEEECLRVLEKIFLLRNLWELCQLEILFQRGTCSVHDSWEVLANIPGRFLRYVTLRGVCCSLSDPGDGPGALKDLLTSLPVVQTLKLDVEPATFPLHALLPRSTDGRSAEPLARLPDSLRLLTLGDADVPGRLCDSRWLQQLRRVMDDAQKLHVILQGPCLPAKGGGGAPGRGRLCNAVILPHSTNHSCQECPAKVKGSHRVYIGELCDK
ncbi:uncharacterized protein LOC117646913 isoform X2 [Thrips palmi]|uniref:Uncharacterized protein LOC117646913 isoform X2 n=1 Tax=Thrips palmi TaxID=161013 RepID=A0A6P8ZPI2_THRPL|nr:uncharacterized protein LOC117646913 isoform X2 [Thrips palmi]